MKSSLILGCLAALASASDDLFFFESFDEDVFANGKWVKSKVDKYSNQKVLIKPSNTAAVGFENDKGLVLSEEVRHYAIGSLFDKPFTFSDGNDMVLQYGRCIYFLIYLDLLYLIRFGGYSLYAINIFRGKIGRRAAMWWCLYQIDS